MPGKNPNPSLLRGPGCMLNVWGWKISGKPLMDNPYCLWATPSFFLPTESKVAQPSGAYGMGNMQMQQMQQMQQAAWTSKR